MKRCVLGVILLASLGTIMPSQVAAQDNGNQRSHKLWQISSAIFVSASAADAATSWNLREGNPVLRNSQGRFGMKGIAIKSALTAGALLGEYLIGRKNKRAEKVTTVINFAAASVFTATAVHNASIRSSSSRLLTPQP